MHLTIIITINYVIHVIVIVIIIIIKYNTL